jgi:protein disulfide-isomerase
MKTFLFIPLFVASLAPAFAVGLGDSYDQVVAEKGQPAGKLEVGEVMILTYPGQSVRLERGKVAVVKTVGAAAKAAPAPKPVAPPAAVAKKAPETPAPAAEAAWTTDYAAAVAQAKAQKRSVFLFFTGSDWCGWCHKLDQEILSTAEFAKYADENLILVKLDFPQHTPLPAELIAQNRQLARRYNIDGYPTVVVLDSEGRAVKRLGYQAGGPGPFIGSLAQLH